MSHRFYQVNGWEEKNETNRYGRHLCIGVVAASAVRAIMIAQEMYPTARMDSVNNRGIVHAVDEVESSPTQPVDPSIT